ncbi:TIGR03066 family protein [Gemmata sp.]|uniref:TIGR03066 family protein n=1 Tax=Gemmata sp. TaxID=1914242 RepID=UPI003F71B865
MRMVLSCVLAVVAFHPAGADDKKVEKIDEAKLIGKWEPQDRKGRAVEFLKDGKLTVTIPGANGDVKLDGTYTVEGNKLVTVIRAAKQEVKKTITVSELTDTAMSGTDDTGKEDTFVRVKGK